MAAATIKKIKNGSGHYLTMVHQCDPPYSRVVKPSKGDEAVDDWVWVPAKGDKRGALCVHTNRGVAFLTVDKDTQAVSLTWEEALHLEPVNLPIKHGEEPIQLEVSQDGRLEVTSLITG